LCFAAQKRVCLPDLLVCGAVLDAALQIVARDAGLSVDVLLEADLLLLLLLMLLLLLLLLLLLQDPRLGYSSS
jgi:hypothetical protein